MIELAVWYVVDTANQLGVSENIMDDLPRVAVPKLAFGCHPLGSRPVFWAEAIVLDRI